MIDPERIPPVGVYINARQKGNGNTTPMPCPICGLTLDYDIVESVRKNGSRRKRWAAGCRHCEVTVRIASIEPIGGKVMPAPKHTTEATCEVCHKTIIVGKRKSAGKVATFKQRRDAGIPFHCSRECHEKASASAAPVASKRGGGLDG